MNLKTKQIEVKLKKILLGSLSEKKESINIEEAGEYLNHCNKILILRQDRIGDLLVSTQFIDLLRKQLPKAKIDLLLSDKNAGLFELISDKIDNKYIYDKNVFSSSGLLIKLKRNNYDLIIDMFDNPSATSRMIIKLLNPKYSLGFFRKQENIYSHTVKLLDKDKNHIIKRINELLLSFNIENDHDLKVLLPEKEEVSKEDKIGLIIAGSGQSKFYGKDNFVELISLIKDNNIELIGAPGFEKESEEILKEVEIIYKEPSQTLIDFAYSLRSYKLIITPDTSVVHFCSAFNIPCVVLYKLVDSVKYGMPWFPVNTRYEYLTHEISIRNIKPSSISQKINLLLGNK